MTTTDPAADAVAAQPVTLRGPDGRPVSQAQARKRAMAMPSEPPSETIKEEEARLAAEERHEQAAAAALRAGLELVQCGERAGEPTYNLLDARGKRRRRVHVALTLDEVQSVLNGTPTGPAADAAAAGLGPVDDATEQAVITGGEDTTPSLNGPERAAGDDAAEASAADVNGEADVPSADAQDAVDAEIVDGDLTAEEARELTDRIWGAVETLAELVPIAYARRAWIALGHESWEAYCAAELPTLRLSRGERAELVCTLRDADLSIRAIAASVGTGTRQVQEALADQVCSEDHTSPEPTTPVDRPRTTGRDGKTYTKRTPRPKGNSTLPREVVERDRQLSGRHDEEMAEDTTPEPEPSLEETNTVDVALSEPLMKTWELTLRWDGTADLSVEFFEHDAVCIPLGGQKLATQITPFVAADVAEHLKAAVPEIISLGAQLERRGQGGRP